MDDRTIASYEANAETIFQRHMSHGRDRMNQRVLAWFHPAGRTADIGSGSGIMLDWLTSAGFDAVGYEPVPALRKMSVEQFPGISVHDDGLPDLATIPDATFDNVLCSAVLMHLPAESIPVSIASLIRILKPGGRLALSFRHGFQGKEREDDGRLFTPLDLADIATLAQQSDATISDQIREADPDRPGITWSLLLAEKSQDTKLS